MFQPISRALILALVVFLMGCGTPPPTPAPPSAAPIATPMPPATTAPATAPAPKGDAANGAKLFVANKIACDGCHDASKPLPGGEFAPNLGNIATAAEQIIKSPAYTGKAKTVAEYFRESLLEPNLYLVPGEGYTEKDGSSGMTQDFAKTLTPQQVDDLIAYLLTLK